MSGPAIIYIILSIFGAFLSLLSHGEVVRHDAIVSIFVSMVIIGLLAWGGFFDNPENKIHPSECNHQIVNVIPDGYHLEKDAE